VIDHEVLGRELFSDFAAKFRNQAADEKSNVRGREPGDEVAR
jgi:hypothetical protein